MTPYPFLDHPGPIPFAHRGGAATGLENSMAAFARAVELGYRYLETDVHGTADGVLLAFHDRRLGRVTDQRGRIARLPYASVQRARIAGQEPIPLLTDLLEAFPGARINIDVKEVSAIAPLVEVIKRTGCIDRVCVASFSDRRLAAVRDALGPRLCTAVGPIEALGLRTAALFERLHRLAPAGVPCVQLPARLGPLPVVDERLVNLAHGLGMHVHVWTIDNPATMHRLLDLGVDGIMTDRLEVLRDVLVARNAWLP
ncbi:MAG: glycerophosphodiester phosphodiesterase [Sporichthyaceae bacterium]|nr:glycerophosphodiester phosphodiesterase [Sporichthyaceae bacterium]